MNAWEQVDLIAAEALTHLEDSLVITPLTARDKTADFMTRPNGYTVGETVRIKTRPEYQTRDFDADGNVIVRQDIRESTRSMTIEHLFDISVAVTAREKALDLESFADQVIIPAVYTLAESCDQYVASKIKNGAGLYTSDGLFATQADMAQARKAATLQQLNRNRMCLVDLDVEATLLSENYFSTWAQRGPEGAAAFNQGAMGTAMNMAFYSSVNFDNATFTPGTGAGAANNALAGDNAIGSSVLKYDGGSGTFEVGDRIQVAGLKRPLIVATQTTGAAGSIPLVDPITQVIADDAAITTISTGNSAHPIKGAIFDDQSMAVAMPILDAPSDKRSSVAASNGYSIRVVQGYDMDNKTDTLSLDLLIGAEAYDPRRITLLGEY